jgi:hypothetical protein
MGVTRGWGKLHNGELHDLHPWKNIIIIIIMVKTRVNKMGGAYST